MSTLNIFQCFESPLFCHFTNYTPQVHRIGGFKKTRIEAFDEAVLVLPKHITKTISLSERLEADGVWLFTQL